MPGNPYDGHTLASVIPAMEDMIGNTIERLLADATEFDACDDPRITIGMGFFRTPISGVNHRFVRNHAPSRGFRTWPER